jgi:LysR family nod box-dependent transcriptional activator
VAGRPSDDGPDIASRRHGVLASSIHRIDISGVAGMNVGQVDLNLLVALDALLRERSVTRAGERIGLSQPAMSSALARLRRLFADDLLVRTGRDYQLSALAQELEPAVRQIMGLIEATLVRRPDFRPATDERVFSIAASDYATLVVLQPALERIGREAPHVTLHLHPLGPGPGAQLEHAEVDLVIAPRQLDLPFPCETLLTDRWVCAVAADHPDAGNSLTIEQYLALPHLVFASNGDRRMGLADRQVNALGLQRRVLATFESFVLLPFLLRGTRLVTLVQERLVERVCASAGVRLLDPPFEIEEVTEAVYWHPRNASDGALQWLRALIANVASAP